ncbi:uncharacterized protein [Haliotis asinina]|uniref:uncharacterized protein n=1 Tax=Haliotis asinina TaxID=109174 RepID=UPI0035320EAF
MIIRIPASSNPHPNPPHISPIHIYFLVYVNELSAVYRSVSASVSSMIVLDFMWIACLLMAVEGGPCLGNQHCSDCDNTTGHCLTTCDTGYFDLKCYSECDGHCIGNLCNQSADGSGRCSKGCEPGYQGQRCNIPCDSPGAGCTACPDGCDGGYCQLNSSCVSGCVDSHYGRDCDSGDAVGLPLGLSMGLFSLMIVVIVYCIYGQRVRQHKVPKTENPVCPRAAEVDDVSVQELEWYTDIQLTDMTTISESPGTYTVGVEDAGVEDHIYDVADGGKRQCVAVGDIYTKLSHTQ